MPGEVHVIDHPLVQHKLSLMRMKSTSTSAFRNLLGELSLLMAYEVTRDMPTHQVTIDTPLTRTTARMLDGKKIVLISIMRAGAGILDGMLRLLPSARAPARKRPCPRDAGGRRGSRTPGPRHIVV